MKKTWIKTTVVLAIILLVGAAYYLLNKNQSTTPSNNGSGSQTQVSEFRITPADPLQFSCGAPRLPEKTDGIWVTPQGQFCMIAVDAENVTREKKTLSGDGTRLLGDDGQKYMLDLYTMSFVNTSWVDLEPHTPIKTFFVFDIPQGVTPTTVELRNHPEQPPKVVAFPK